MRSSYLLPALLLSLFWLQSLHAQAPAGLDEGIVESEVPGFTKKTLITYFRNGGLDTAYFPFGDVMGMLRVRPETSPNGEVFTGHMGDNWDFVINTRAFTLTTPTGTAPIDPSTFLRVDDELYIRDTLIAMALGVKVAYKQDELKLVFDVDPRLPVIDYIRSRARWKDAMTPQDSLAENQIDFTFSRPVIGPATFNYSVGGNYTHISTNDVHSSGSFGQANVTLPLLFGQFTAGGRVNQLVLGDGERKPKGVFTGWTYTFVIPEFTPLSEIALFGLGFDHNLGARISNRPLGYRAITDYQVLEGTANPFSLVEIYRGTVLHAVSQADSSGNYYLRVPIFRGAREFYTTIATDQYATRAIEEHTFGNPYVTMDPGAIWYAGYATIDSARPNTRINGQFSIDIGLFPWMSLTGAAGASADTLNRIKASDTLTYDITNLYGGARFAIGPYVGADANYEYMADRAGLSVSTDLIRALPISMGIANVRLKNRDSMWVDPIANFSTGYYADRLNIALGATGSRDEIATLPAVSYSFENLGVSLNATIKYPMRRRVGEFVDTLVKLNTVNLIAVRGLFSTSFMNFPRLTLDLTYDPLRSRMSVIFLETGVTLGDIDITASALIPDETIKRTIGRVSASMSTDLFSARAASVANYVSQGFSASLNGAAQVASSGVRLVRDIGSQSTIVLTAYNDRNGNGLQDEGEEELRNPIGQVSVVIPDIRQEGQISNEDGVFLAVPIYTDLVLEIDRFGLADLDMFPSRTLYGAYIGPSSVRSFHVPFRRGYTLSGQCYVERPNLEGKVVRTTRGLASVRIWLEATGGVGMYEGELFDDGSLMIIGVPEGEYRVKFDQAQLGYRRIQLADPSMVVVVSEGTTKLPDLILVPTVGDAVSPNPDE